jgi:hypothetical protein
MRNFLFFLFSSILLLSCGKSSNPVDSNHSSGPASVKDTPDVIIYADIVMPSPLPNGAVVEHEFTRTVINNGGPEIVYDLPSGITVFKGDTAALITGKEVFFGPNVLIKNTFGQEYALSCSGSLGLYDQIIKAYPDTVKIRLTLTIVGVKS